jgi:hypothetical protein
MTMWTKIVSWLFPWLMTKAMKVGAKAFRKKYPPAIHAAKSRKYMWDNYWSKWILRCKETKNPVDDIGADFLYFYNTAWVDDGALSAYLDKIDLAARQSDPATILNTVTKIRRLIGPSED